MNKEIENRIRLRNMIPNRFKGLSIEFSSEKELKEIIKNTEGMTTDEIIDKYVK